MLLGAAQKVHPSGPEHGSGDSALGLMCRRSLNSLDGEHHVYASARSPSGGQRPAHPAWV